MPYLKIETNLPASKIPENFVLEASKVVASTLGKPPGYCCVGVIPDMPMAFGGTKEPCGIASLMSIGQLGVEENKKHAAAIFQLIKDTLGIPNDRMYITFHDAPMSDVGYKGTTFHEIFGL